MQDFAIAGKKCFSTVFVRMFFSSWSLVVKLNPISAACFAGFLFLTGCSSCTKQHDPSADHALFEQEQATASKEQPLLAEGGGYPEPQEEAPAGDATASADPIDSKFQTYCSTCHGTAGDANSPAAQAMNPKPRNFTDAAWQNSVDDAHIEKVIREGGASVGLSPTMAPWGGVLTDDEIKGLVKKVRSFNKG
jgi:mono/diheme cytochrome c family protein